MDAGHRAERSSRRWGAPHGGKGSAERSPQAKGPAPRPSRARHPSEGGSTCSPNNVSDSIYKVSYVILVFLQKS